MTLIKELMYWIKREKIFLNNFLKENLDISNELKIESKRKLRDFESFEHRLMELAKKDRRKYKKENFSYSLIGKITKEDLEDVIEE